MGACVFTHPIETVKTRLQVQGELAGSGVPRPYRNMFHAFAVIARTEGFRALQAGLPTALLFQVAMNGTRLGCYDSVLSLYKKLSVSHVSFPLLTPRPAPPPPSPSSPRLVPFFFYCKHNFYFPLSHTLVQVASTALSGATCGALAGFLGSPLFLVKVRMQIKQKSGANAPVVGHQHAAAEGVVEGFRALWAENGLKVGKGELCCAL
jgi:solute carrier family 25 protein 34/35